MQKHKALLIGASDYSDSPSFGDLPFVRDDLQRLREVLTGRGFQADVFENRRGITVNTVRGAIHSFLDGARQGDTLLIVLSGHGLHIEGKDYLVPEDAPDTDPFIESCVEVGWHKHVERSSAERVVFLIDTCREGRTPDTKSVPGTRRWKPPEIIATLRRKVAYVHACAAPEVARFIRETDTLRPGYDVGAQQGESFSIFSRAVADVITADPHALRLREFAVQVQGRVDEYYRAYGKPNPPQQVKVTCETDADGGDFPLLPGAERRTEVHPWVRGVDEYPWHRTPEGPSRETLQDVCRALADRLAQTHDEATRALSGDPWHDGDLAARTHKRLGFLVSRLPDGVRLSATESALTYLFPLIAQTFWAQEAAQRVGVLTSDSAPGPDHGRFQKFGQGFPRLKRRLIALEHQRAAGSSAQQKEAARASMERIRWWLFHRWLIQQPELYSAERLKELLGDLTSGGAHPQWVTDALSPERLMQLLREHRAAPFSMRRSTTGPARRGPREDRVVIAASTLVEQVVRTSLVTAVVKAAQAMAVDPLDLPEIVVEHLGIHDSVDLDQLLITVRQSDWQVSGLGRSLNAVCTHPAVQVALREHATRVDELLRDIAHGDDPALDPLEGLPPYADGSRVRPDGNTPEELSDGIRFQLAEDRVQELLMGEELYGDSELAVRELYQNALDAVRYRDRRTEYLRRTDRSSGDWAGRITFTQGVRPDGRPYLECRDNGIGMGITELSTVFSHGGARFVDLPEYIDEQAAWAELPGRRLELHPNSRFGIGVLSYFMLADEIVVRTCRMGREDGRPRRLLQVTIAGPGNFFRVEDKGEGRPEDIGTTVTLLLGKDHRSVSCVEALQKVLWVAPYRTAATHGARNLEWLPGELSRTALATSNPYRFARRGHTVCLDSADPNLWWVGGKGAVLADGVYAEGDNEVYGNEVYGAVINLQGEKSPELTVDRKTLRSFDREHVKTSMIAAVSSLTDPDNGLPNASWLQSCSSWSVPVADAVAEHIRRTDTPWQLTDGCSVPFSRLGFFSPDMDLLPLITGDYKEADPALSASFLANLPLPVLRWRLRTLYRAGFGGPVSLPDTDETDSLCARPSDLVLLCADRTGFLGWSTWHEGWLKGPRSSFFLHGSAPSQSLVETGWGSLGLLFPWRDPAITVSTAEIFRLSSAVEQAPADIAERLTAMEYRIEPLSGCAAARHDDLPLLRPLGDLAGWLSPGATLTSAQIAVSAAQASCPTSQAARRLAELGFSVPADYPVKEQWTKEERSVVEELWTPYDTPPSPQEAVHVSPVQLREVTHLTDLPLRFVTELLSHLGFDLSPDVSALPELTDDDRVLIDGPAVRVDREIPLRYMVDTARRLGRPLHDIAARLRELGYAVPDIPDEDQLPTPEEVAVLGTHYALADPGHPVPLGDVVEFANRAESSLAEAADRLASLGYRFSFEPAALSPFRKQDVDVLSIGDDFGRWPRPDGFGPVSLAALHAAAQQTGKDHRTVARSLGALGFDVVPLPEGWFMERVWEGQLSAFLDIPDATPAMPSPDPSCSLVTLALVAMRAGKSLREAALKATEWGIRHEAETWFIPAAAEPPAPSASATPPPTATAPPHGC